MHSPLHHERKDRKILKAKRFFPLQRHIAKRFCFLHRQKPSSGLGSCICALCGLLHDRSILTVLVKFIFELLKCLMLKLCRTKTYGHLKKFWLHNLDYFLTKIVLNLLQVDKQPQVTTIVSKYPKKMKMN